MQKRIVLILAAITALVIASFSNTTYAQTAPVQADGFGAISITSRQVFRVNVAYIRSAVETRGGEIPPGPCRIEIKLINERGTVVAQAEKIIAPGETASLDYSPDRPERTTLRAVVILHRSPGANIPPDPCVPTVEVVSRSSGDTVFVYPGTTRFVKEVD